MSEDFRANDANGNTQGALANTYTYDSFGNLVASSGSIVNNFRYTGREWDPETSLYYYRARYYDLQTGRFTKEDPLRFGAGSNNFYGYVRQNAVNYADPFGKRPFRAHGNWCGPGWTGGQWESFNPAHWNRYARPVDDTDEVCMHHDVCYFNCRAKNPCSTGDRQNCMKQCDQVLISEVPNTFWGNVVGFAIKHFNKDPDPGTDAECGCKK